MKQGFSAGQLHTGKPQGFCLLYDGFKKIFRENRIGTAFILEFRRNPAVATAQVAALSQVKIKLI